MMGLLVNYELQDMSLEDHAKLGSEVAPNFKPENVDGLIGKTFIGDVDAGVFGGVYYFKSKYENRKSKSVCATPMRAKKPCKSTLLDDLYPKTKIKS